MEKILWSGTHIMRDDLCRRFTFGITVEDTQLRLWFFGRVGVLVSSPFNWLEVEMPFLLV